MATSIATATTGCRIDSARATSKSKIFRLHLEIGRRPAGGGLQC